MPFSFTYSSIDNSPIIVCEMTSHSDMPLINDITSLISDYFIIAIQKSTKESGMPLIRI